MQEILLLSGSLRKDSVNTKLLQAFAAQVAPSVAVTWADINLPLFNEDLEADVFPAAVTKLKQQIDRAEHVIIATPEYNRTMSGALKNALDWASRPYGESSWSGQSVCVVSASPGGIGGALAYYDVVKCLHHLGAVIPTGKEFILSGAFAKFDEQGQLIDETTKDRIISTLQALNIPTK